MNQYKFVIKNYIELVVHSRAVVKTNVRDPFFTSLFPLNFTTLCETLVYYQNQDTDIIHQS